MGQLYNRIHCNYLMALGNLGLGDRKAAGEFLAETLALEPGHMMGNLYAADLKEN